MVVVVEEWRPVPGTMRGYSVSSLGRVRSEVMPGPTGRGRVRGNVLAPLSNGRGYYQVNLSRNGKFRKALIHRMVAAAFLGPLPDGLEVNHLNGIKSDNRIENLEYTTRAGNMQHAKALGLLRRKKPKQQLAHVS